MKNRNIPHKDDWATPPYFYDELNGEFDFNFKDRITTFRDGCLYAIEKNEPVEFH